MHIKPLSVLVLSLIALNIYVATIPEAPRWLIILFGAIAIVAQIVKDNIVEHAVENGNNTRV